MKLLLNQSTAAVLFCNTLHSKADTRNVRRSPTTQVTTVFTMSTKSASFATHRLQLLLQVPDNMLKRSVQR